MHLLSDRAALTPLGRCCITGTGSSTGRQGHSGMGCLSDSLASMLAAGTLDVQLLADSDDTTAVQAPRLQDTSRASGVYCLPTRS